jgi:hypothetical protein
MARDDAGTDGASEVGAGEAQNRKASVAQTVHQFFEFPGKQAEDGPCGFRGFVWADDPVIVAKGCGEIKLVGGDFFVTEKAFEAEATKFGSNCPTADDIVATERSEAVRSGLAEKGKDSRSLPEQTPLNGCAQHVQTQSHAFSADTLRHLRAEKNPYYRQSFVGCFREEVFDRMDRICRMERGKWHWV